MAGNTTVNDDKWCEANSSNDQVSDLENGLQRCNKAGQKRVHAKGDENDGDKTGNSY